MSIPERPTESDAIKLLRQFLILRRDTFDEFADKAVTAFGVVSTELTHLRERNAELEKADADWRRISINQGNELYAQGVRIASLEARNAEWEATVRGMRDKIDRLKNHAKADQDFFAKEYGPACMGVVYANNKIRLCDEALALSDSVVKSETSVEITDEARASFGKSPMDHFHK